VGKVVVEESRVLPAWNSSRPDRLSGLVARKSGLGSGSLEDSVPIRCLSPSDLVENAERWAELGSLEDLCSSNTWARPTKLEAQKGGLSR
jgi:hypothetical protein